MGKDSPYIVNRLDKALVFIFWFLIKETIQDITQIWIPGLCSNISLSLNVCKYVFLKKCQLPDISKFDLMTYINTYMYISKYKQMCVYIPLRDQPCYKFSFEPGPLILYSKGFHRGTARAVPWQLWKLILWCIHLQCLKGKYSNKFSGHFLKEKTACTE